MPAGKLLRIAMVSGDLFNGDWLHDGNLRNLSLGWIGLPGYE